MYPHTLVRYKKWERLACMWWYNADLKYEGHWAPLSQYMKCDA